MSSSEVPSDGPSQSLPTIAAPDSESISDPPPPPSLIVLIKNPTDRPGTKPFTVTVPVTSTILQIKQRLSHAYPGSPPVSAQRLIYAGKLLQNSSSLSALIPNPDLSATHTFHLVVPSSATPSTPSWSTANAASSSSTSTSGPGSNSGSAPTFASTPVPGPTPTPRATPSSSSAAAASSHAHAFNSAGGSGSDGAQVPPPSPMGAGSSATFNQLPNNGAGLPQYLPYFGYPFYPAAPPYSVDPIAGSTDATAAYRAHLQTMERLIAESWQAHMHSAAASAAALANAQNTQLAAQLRMHANQLGAHAAALQAQAQVQARAHATVGISGLPPLAPLPPQQPGQNAQPFDQQQQHHAHVHAMVPPELNAQGDGQVDREMAERAAAAAVAAAERVLAEARPGNNGRPPVQGVFDVRFGRFPADANIRPGEARVRQYVFRFHLNWVLLLKLFVFVYVLGQDASRQRVYGLIALAITIYMWQMGYLRFIRRLVESTLPDPRTLINQLLPTARRPAPQHAQRDNNPQGTPVDGTQLEQQQLQQDRAQQQPLNPLAQQNHRLGRIAIFVSFIYSFVYGFICSLLPAWNPEPHARFNELLPRNAGGQGENGDAAHDGNAQNDGRHEHAD